MPRPRKTIAAIISSGDVIQIGDEALVEFVSDRDGRIRVRIKASGYWNIHRKPKQKSKSK